MIFHYFFLPSSGIGIWWNQNSLGVWYMHLIDSVAIDNRQPEWISNIKKFKFEVIWYYITFWTINTLYLFMDWKPPSWVIYGCQVW